MRTEVQSNKWQLLVGLAIWLPILSIQMSDLKRSKPVSLGWFIGSSALPFGICANLFSKESRYRWLFGGIAIGLVLASLTVSLYMRYGGGSTIR